MATSRSPYYNPSSTGTNTYGGGKFRVKVAFTISNAGISFTPTLVITDAFTKKHTIKIRWTDENGAWQSATASAQRKAKGTYNYTTRTIKAQKINVEVIVGAYICTFSDIVNEGALVKPSSITATKVNDSYYQIQVIGTGTVGVPAETVVIERATDTQSSWSSICEAVDLGSQGTSNYEVLVNDEDVDAGHKYWWRAKATNEISGDSGYVISAMEEFTAPTTSDVTISSVERNSNNSCSIDWSISSVSSVSRGLITSFTIMRRTNSGTWNEVGTVQATTTTTSYTYTDTSCSADNTYQYGIKVNGSGGTSYDTVKDSTVITMSPSAPSSVSISRNSSDDVIVKITGSSNTATNVCIEKNIDDEGWESVAEEDYPCSSYTDEEVAAGDNIIYRVRYKNSELSGSDQYSSYTTSNTLLTKAKPNKPTLLSPVSGANIALDSGSVRLTWRHNATDGSAQEHANIQYKINSGSWVTVTATTDAFYTLSIASGYNANDVISWKVSTKGAHADYSDYSDVSTFTILTKPQLTFTQPSNGSTITTLPVTLGWTYSDQCGTLASLTAEIIKENEIVKTISVPVGQGASGSYTYSLAGFLFDNNSVYSIRATALSSTGLNSVQTITIAIEYAPVSLSGALVPIVSCDSETGYAYVSIARDISPDSSGNVPTPISISECYLYRLHDNEKVLVADGLADGDVVEDKYAPINIDYTYQLLMITSDSRISIVEITANNPSSYWFVYYGDKVAKAIWNPTGSVALSRPQKTQVRYSGRKYPVTYDQDAMEETFDFSTVIFDRNEITPFREMMQSGGQGIWKSGDGDVYDADFEFTYSFGYDEGMKKYDCQLTVTRIEGDQ